MASKNKIDYLDIESLMGMKFPIMKCGHKANGIDINGEFACLRKSCFGKTTGYDVVRR